MLQIYYNEFYIRHAFIYVIIFYFCDYSFPWADNNITFFWKCTKNTCIHIYIYCTVILYTCTYNYVYFYDVHTYMYLCTCAPCEISGRFSHMGKDHDCRWYPISNSDQQDFLSKCFKYKQYVKLFVVFFIICIILNNTHLSLLFITIYLTLRILNNQKIALKWRKIQFSGCLQYLYT